MEGTSAQIEYAQGILQNSLINLATQEKGVDAGGDEWKVLKAVQFALDSVERWGISAAKIIDLGKSVGRLNASDINGLLEDESITSEEFYSSVWDYVDSFVS
jgi:hypothetical protein